MRKVNWWRPSRDAAAVFLGRKIAVDAEFAGQMLDAATSEMNVLIGLTNRPPATLSLTKGDGWHIAPGGIVRVHRRGHLCRSILLVDEDGASTAAHAAPPPPGAGGPNQTQHGPATPLWRD